MEARRRSSRLAASTVSNGLQAQRGTKRFASLAESKQAKKVKQEPPKEKVKQESSLRSQMCKDGKSRCFWATGSELYIKYHDEEWGKPLRSDDGLFEMLCLEGAQAGLSWITILRKRENYRRGFKNFNIDKVATMTDEELHALLEESDPDKMIVRHKGKVFSVRSNAIAAQNARREFGSFDKYLWSFAPSSPHSEKHKQSNPSVTKESEALSKDLKKRGFKFVGPTIVYAFMQAVGMVDDHMVGCFLHQPTK